MWLHACSVGIQEGRRTCGRKVEREREDGRAEGKGWQGRQWRINNNNKTPVSENVRVKPLTLVYNLLNFIQCYVRKKVKIKEP